MKQQLWQFTLALVWISTVPGIRAQTAGIPLQSPAYHLLDRLEIKSGIGSPLHPEIKFANRREALAYALRLDTAEAAPFSARDKLDIQYLIKDNTEWLTDSMRDLQLKHRSGWLKYFYRSAANFLEVNTPDFHLRVNPLLNFQLGQASGDFVFQNQRGLELRGAVDQKLFFYTNLIETQAGYPEYVHQYINANKAVPGAGFFKSYESKVSSQVKGYDFNVANAYLGFQATRHFGIQLGHGKHFIGNGYRSMFLSDFGAPTFFLKLDTRVWRFHYQNLFLELSPVSQVNIPDGIRLPKKYAAIHYLNFKATPRLAFGLFEATIFNRSDQFELQYLNPVVFYRTVEGMIGSPDNVLLGMDARWNLFKRIQVYGQAMLDELVVSEVFANRGWWANKWALQAGIKYLDAFGVPKLDLQLEHNRVRPYTYAHNDPANSYTHYNQVLAHPLGANFKETLLVLHWSPLQKLYLQGRMIHAMTGENSLTENWGSDPLLSYDSRVQDYGNKIGQGLKSELWLLGLDASWSLWHNLFLDLKYLYRQKDSRDTAQTSSTQVFSAGIRLNLWNQNLDF